MKKSIFYLLTIVSISITTYAQESNSSLVSGMGIYVFPADGQDAAKQFADESSCITWAKNQSGYDPLNPPTIQGAEVDQSPDGSAVRGAARGAAAGAAIGAITGDAGDGAAIGAIAGGIRGRRAKRAQDSYQQQSNNAAASNKLKELENSFKKAFAACIESKGYTVKF